MTPNYPGPFPFFESLVAAGTLFFWIGCFGSTELLSLPDLQDPAVTIEVPSASALRRLLSCKLL